MKQATVAILLIAFFAANFSKPFIVADYYLNTAAYAKDCINKARPKMNCKGQCQMMKKIREEEKKEAEQKGRIEELKNEVISSQSFFPVAPTCKATTAQLLHAPVRNQKETCKRERSCFHPPSVTS